ncbi:SDR family oxidoreductase [Marispirochaeta aestuarii]|uniref:SDR family NAD(P)-dependent oxidoreductase n=1 Tax=Marispirochaeta aestuarii TaxID=1963862 RepID=UPI002ABDCF8E|nr:SDR family oxidoreductase [Marispirochaeta aestuarii]
MKNTKVALVTGGGTGIGRATALGLAAKGVSCVVNYSRSRQDAENTVSEINSLGGDAIAVCADVGNEEAVRQMVDTIVQHYGRIDYLVNNAGRTVFIPMEEIDALTEEHWNSIFDVNIKGTFRVMRACAAELKKNSGAIVNVSSIASFMGRGSSIPYCVSKAGIDNLTKCFARILAPRVRVNAVAPGIVETRWVEGKEEHVKLQSEGTLLKRVCQPQDVAEVINDLLCSAGFVTGQTLTIDGGFTL